MTDRALAHVLDVVVFLRGVVARLGTFFQRVMETGRKPGSADQANRIFEERIVVQNAQDLGFDVGDSVEGIEQQSPRAGIERQRHGVDGEVAAAQVLVDGGRRDGRRLARLVVDLRARHVQLGPDIARHQQVKNAQVLVHPLYADASFFQLFLELERIALDAEVDVADGKASDQIADGAAG